MGAQRPRHKTVRRAQGPLGQRLHWVLLAGATGAMVLAGCSGPGESQLQAGGGTTDVGVGNAGTGSSGTEAVVTVGEASTSGPASSGSGPPTTSATTVTYASATTPTTARASHTGTTVNPSNIGSPSAAPTAPAGAPTAPTAPSSPQPQTIIFAVPGGGAVKYADGRTIALGATASSGLPVVYDAPGGQPCELQGGGVALIGTGSCTISASQAGNGQWLPAQTVEVAFDVLNGDSDFNLDAPGTVAATDGVVTLRLTNIVGSDSFTVTGSGACPDGTDVTGSSSFNLTLSGPGTCTVTVDQNGNQNFNIGPTRTADITVT